MPRFLKRIFPDHLFRRDAPPHTDVSHLQRSRRVLVRPSTNALYESSASNWRLGGVFYEGEGETGQEERRALRDGASVAESEAVVGLGSEFADLPREQLAGRKESRARRRLSKRHRMPV
ncbi:hypothetical protein COCC4DRAFT_72006 [Bipolaris maydis ATCC 48331]|uniref:Uncharacterized protein n=2 Tax=Cochliobolus heterostrophus TaxID=5016 RepID=M2TQ12_COCH5|nr:uncharacterized protein COCC4DRAFT_72006 [Bipolaris maydis ATCC 48331]EMD88654.1 hypothetical protein COCHEDRAFT_1196602 [Bipolaris maydis C5]KAJ5028750.1 hypothetical protein J3E73DRAFT_421972 [Bipolaris maydis]ENI05629.1 hypothetical protein COCC4DRAFT_72006 [Bipolaris maydis ATCC 48331]KAJ5063542.1 hypothetical protein J3E74DRAFT_472483 [Bipolaris maydis]KAJ6205593.1 hypothetical protein PSV09DRAFT_1196602 [Bipolaris maydis]